MCTITFIPRLDGYALAMNRDERLTRVTALPPANCRIGACEVVCPSEPGGGTWIGLNDTGACLGLINWYSVPARVRGKSVSRGDVVRSALAADSARVLEEALSRWSLCRVNPFRLIGIFPGANEVVEWRWNRNHLARVEHAWRINTWISSGFDEPGAQQTRNKTFTRALRRDSTLGLDWLRRLHRSHEPERGPYSTCMHREDAATVSYTEVVVSQRTAVMRYSHGSPCGGTPASVHRLGLKCRPYGITIILPFSRKFRDGRTSNIQHPTFDFQRGIETSV